MFRVFAARQGAVSASYRLRRIRLRRAPHAIAFRRVRDASRIPSGSTRLEIDLLQPLQLESERTQLLFALAQIRFESGRVPSHLIALLRDRIQFFAQHATFRGCNIDARLAVTLTRRGIEADAHDVVEQCESIGWVIAAVGSRKAF